MEHHNCLLVDTAWLGFLPRGVGVGWVGTGTLLGPGITNPVLGVVSADRPTCQVVVTGSWLLVGGVW